MLKQQNSWFFLTTQESCTQFHQERKIAEVGENIKLVRLLIVNTTSFLELLESAGNSNLILFGSFTIIMK